MLHTTVWEIPIICCHANPRNFVKCMQLINDTNLVKVSVREKSRRATSYLSISLQILGLCFAVLHIQHLLVPRVLVWTQQLRQRIVELWEGGEKRGRIKTCKNVQTDTHTLLYFMRIGIKRGSSVYAVPCRLSSVALFRSSSSLISWASCRTYHKCKMSLDCIVIVQQGSIAGYRVK